ncbi:hypothetical protein BH09VER1_BH09VER1_34070 [soil metagenome]
MSDPVRDELTELRAAQRDLRRQMEQLDRRIETLADAVVEEEAKAKRAPIAPPPPPIPQAAIPPALETKKEPEMAQPIIAEPIPTAPVEVEPPVTEPAPAPTFQEAKASIPPPPPPPVPPSLAPPVPAPPKVPEPMEMKVGRYWLNRIGIVTILTGFVFFGNFAYHKLIDKLGHGGKLALLTLAAMLLGGLAYYLHRKSADLRNYARVLGAGAAALGYYCAYAAHFVEPLKVITSPQTGGVLLILVGLGMALVADRIKSQGTALLAILLSFYTASINPQPGFALFSNVILIAAALVLLLRHEWVALSFASLVAAYGSFAYWQFVRAGTDAPSQGLATVMAFLAAYWILFTICVFASRSLKLKGSARAAYLTTNNGAFFSLASAAIAHYQRDQFWLFSLGFGVVLIFLAIAAWLKDKDDALFDGSYLAQGLALIALGVSAHFSGYQLYVIFAVESALLLAMSHFRHRILLTLFSLLSGAAATMLALFDLGQPSHIIPAVLFLLVAAVLAKRGGFKELTISPLSLTYTGAVLLLAGLCAWSNLSLNNTIAVLALSAVFFCFTVRLHRMPEIAFGIQLYLVAADFLWGTHEKLPVGLALLLLITNLALMHWWQRQKAVKVWTEEQVMAEGGWSLAIAVILYLWLQPYWEGPYGLSYLALLAAAILSYGMATRAWMLAALSAPFTVGAVAKLVQALCLGPEQPYRELLAIGIIAGQLPIISLLRRQLTEVQRTFVPYVQMVFRLVICGLLIIFLFARIPAAWQPAVLAAASIVAFLVAHLNKSREPLAYCIALAGGFFAVFLVRTIQREDLGLVSVLPLLAVLGLQAVGKRTLAERFPATAQMGILWWGVLELLLFTTLQVWDRHLGHLLTIAWALLAVAVTGSGFLLRERLLRLLGLGILALAVLHVYLIDVWQTESVYRYLSFILLGALLLGLSFAYNKLAPIVRRWL